MTLHRVLALAMLLVGGGVAAYGSAGFLSTSGPLRVVILVFFVLPFLTFCLGWWALPRRLGRGAGAAPHDAAR